MEAPTLQEMLNVYLGNMPEAVYNTAVFFENDYEDEWILDPLVKEMIQDVDHSSVIDSGVIDSPVLGIIPPLSLSGGVKTLILMANDDTGRVFNASACGDNCAKWIQRIALTKDLTITLHHIMHFEGDFEAEILNDQTKVRSVEEYVLKAVSLI